MTVPPASILIGPKETLTQWIPSWTELLLFSATLVAAALTAVEDTSTAVVGDALGLNEVCQQSLPYGGLAVARGPTGDHLPRGCDDHPRDTFHATAAWAILEEE